MLEKLCVDDVSFVMKIIDDAKVRMKNDGLNQWQDGYPNEQTILNDITKEQIYKYVIGNEIAGVCVINSDFYKQYPTHAPKNLCQTIHRFAVNEKFLGKQIGVKLFKYAEKLIKDKGYEYAIVDTYTLNTKMRRLIEKCEYTNMGEFELVKGEANWVLYQKKL